MLKVVRQASIFVLIIGQTWHKSPLGPYIRPTITTPYASRLSAQLEKKIRSFCVYTHDTNKIPSLNSEDLPPSMKSLPYRPAFRLRDDESRYDDLEDLVLSINHTLTEKNQDLAAEHPQPSQVAQIVRFEKNKPQNIWSGYAISSDLLITAAHQLPEEEETTVKEVHIYFSQNTEALHVVEVVSKGSDIALLRFRPSLPTAESVTFALGRPEDMVKWETIGYREPSRSILGTPKFPSTTLPELIVNGHIKPELLDTGDYDIHIDTNESFSSTLIGLPLFYRSYIIGIICFANQNTKEIDVSSPEQWLSEAELVDHMTGAQMVPSGWLPTHHLRNRPAHTKLYLYLFEIEDQPYATLSTEDGKILYDCKPILKKPFPGYASTKKLAEAFRQGQTEQLTRLLEFSLSGRHQALNIGQWLSDGIFGDSRQRTALLDKAGWGLSANLGDKPVALTIYTSDEAKVYESLPWRTLATHHPRRGTLRLFSLGQQHHWTVTIGQTQQQTRPIEIKRPAKILFIHLIDIACPSGEEFDSIEHFNRLERIIRHAEKQTYKIQSTHNPIERLASKANSTSTTIDIASNRKQIFDLLGRHNYDVIYLYGPGMLNEDLSVTLYNKENITASEFKQLLSHNSVSIFACNTSEYSSSLWYDFADELREIAGYIIINPMSMTTSAAKEYGQNLFTSIFRFTEDPSVGTWHTEKQTWPSARWYNPVIYKQDRVYKPTFEKVESYESLEDLLHQLDRIAARQFLREKIKQSITTQEQNISSLGFVYIGQSNNQVSFFSKGLAQYIQEEIPNAFIIPLYPTEPSENETFERTRNIRQYIKQSIEEAVSRFETQHRLQVYADTQYTENLRLIFWVHWNHQQLKQTARWQAEEVAQWQKISINRIQKSLISKNRKTPHILNTYTKNLKNTTNHGYFEQQLAAELKTIGAQSNSTLIIPWVELGNICEADVSKFLGYAPTLFLVPSQHHQTVSKIISQRSNGLYVNAHKLLKQLYELGWEDFIHRHKITDIQNDTSL